ncbi:hypothetical protein [Algoriphagus sp. PAP.12]|uniref:hypothetical protein n=1 Tax=Algoriphagus sp. PAP.12 TaxID=2996678 RepID=UPI00227B84ED|nr:hypothetical protein [Algoriphagus sp. PAP.12]
MITSIFTQKNICAALGLAMAMTIVIKAKSESHSAQHTARFEITKPTPQVGNEKATSPEAVQVDIYKIEDSQTSGNS